MRVLLDACVLFPTVMREVLLQAAGLGLFEPLWSDRILEEWARAARKLGDAGEVVARGEIALVRSRWPTAAVAAPPELEQQIWLPDPNDRHVLASAIQGQAACLVTLNLRDFPRSTLREAGIALSDPDQFLLGLPDRGAVAAAVAQVHATAQELSGERLPLRKLLKKARLPRLGKALGDPAGAAG